MNKQKDSLSAFFPILCNHVVLCLGNIFFLAGCCWFILTLILYVCYNPFSDDTFNTLWNTEINSFFLLCVVRMVEIQHTHMFKHEKNTALSLNFINVENEYGEETIKIVNWKLSMKKMFNGFTASNFFFLFRLWNSIRECSNIVSTVGKYLFLLLANVWDCL